MNAEAELRVIVARMRGYSIGLARLNHPTAARGAAVARRLADGYERAVGSIDDAVSKGLASLRKSSDSIDARLDRLERQPRGSGPLGPFHVRLGTPDQQDRDRVTKRAPIDRVPFTKVGRRGEPVPFERPLIAKAVKTYSRAIQGALAATRKNVVAQLHNGLLGKSDGALVMWLAKPAGFSKALVKAGEDGIDPQSIADGLDLSDLETLATDDTLATVAGDSASEAISGLLGGVEGPSSKLVNQVNIRAAAIARDRAAEMVGKQIDDDGNIVDNPDAQWAITDSTRDMIRQAISDGLENNLGRDQIIDNVATAGAFDDDRAETIATTEIARANSLGALEGYRGASDAGVNVKKEWLLGSEACDECQENADAGPIDLDDDFPSGDDAPPAHPNCRCALSPVVYDDESASKRATLH